MYIEVDYSENIEQVLVTRELVEAYDYLTDTYVEAWKSDTIEVTPYNYHLLPEHRQSYSLV